MKLSDKISLTLQRMAKGSSAYEILIPNYYYGYHEMDLFRMMPSGLVIEYEIKISRSDFKADFKKIDKHKRLVGGLGPNRFFFVVPENLVKEHEVPDYAGLIYYSSGVSIYSDAEYETMDIIRNAPMLHKKKSWEKYPDVYKMLAQSLAFRDQISRGRIIQLKKELNALRDLKKATNG
jgi:hypothetical protein